MAKKRYLPLAVVLVLLVGLLILLAAMLGRKKAPAQTEAPDLTAGVAYLTGLEQQDPAQVDQILKDQRAQELQQLRAQRLQELESGGVSVWSLFQDYVLLGDSRAESFGFYEFLSKDRCLAEIGTNIDDALDKLPQVKSLNPSMVFLSYGLNDLELGLWATPEEYAAEYEAILAAIWKECPDATIYINSILPVTEDYTDYDAVCDLIPEYSAALKSLCDRTEHCFYIDNDAIVQENPDLYEPDGVHFVADFYPIWAENMMMEVYDSEIETSEDPAA